MRVDRRGVLDGMLSTAERFTMGLHIARRMLAARVTKRYSTQLLDQARAWGITPSAKA